MNDEVAVIKEHPVAIIKAFDTERFCPRLAAFFLDETGNRPDLCRIVGRAYYKVVSDDGKALKFKENDILGLFLERCFRSADGKRSNV